MSNKNPNRKKPNPAALRARGEELLNANPDELPSVAIEDVQALVHELNVHQMELEIQNQELRDAQVELSHSRDRFADLFDFAPVGYVILSKTGVIEEINLTAATLIGQPRQQLVGGYLSKFVHPDFHDRFYLHREAVFSSENKQVSEVQLVRNDGTVIMVRMESLPYGNAPEQQCRMALIDVTDMTAIRHALEESEELYRRLTHAVTDYVYHVQVAHGRAIETIHGANCEAVTGYRPEDFQRNPLLWIAMVPVEDRPLVEAQVEQVLAGQPAPPIEHRIQHKCGELRWVLNTVSPEFDQHGKLIAYYGLLRDITLRKSAEESLQELNDTLEKRVAEQTQEFRLLAEALASLSEGVMITDANLDTPGPVISYVNAALCRMTGYAEEELLGQTPCMLQGTRKDCDALRQFRLALQEQRPYRCELVNYRKDGTPYDVEIDVSPIVDVLGNTTHFIGILRNITARKKVEAALQAEHQLNVSIINTAQNLILLLDPRGRILQFNRFAEELTGWTFAEVARRDWFETFIPERDREVIRRLFMTALAGDRTIGNINPIVTKAGRELQIEWFDAPLMDSDGTLIGLLCTGRDVTERILSEAALQESESRQQAILKTAADAIITIDLRGSIISVNAATVNMFGYSEQELVGHNIKRLMPQPYRDEHDQYLARYLETGEPRIIGFGREVSAMRKDGSTFPVSLAVSRVGHLDMFTGIVRDLSDLRNLQQRVLQIATDEQSRIGQDLHDGVGQELTGLSLMAEALVSRMDTTRQAPQVVEISRKLAAGLQRVLAEVRLIVRGLIPVQIDPQGLSSALRDLTTHIQELYSIACEVDIPEQVSVHGSETATHLFRIAQEACTNAVKHGKAQRIVISLNQSGSQLFLEISDDGIGIGEHRIPPSGRVTLEFTGMGTRIMAYRAWLIGGHLSIRAGKAGGTRVSCLLESAEPTPGV